MTARGKKYLMKPLALLLAAMTLEGCISPEADEIGRYTAPIGGAPVISNETPYSQSLRCLSGYTKTRPVRLAVGQIADYTGKTESDGSGRKLTQAASLMAMSALSKAGVRMVERFDTSVTEMELKYANNKLIGEDNKAGEPDYRKILSGSIPGSDYTILGGITELNFNLRSVGANGTGGQTTAIGVKGTIGANMYVMNVAMDIRLVDTSTLEVVDVIPVQKQIYGRQISAGVFDFLGGTFFDASVGESALEPIQLAVRSVLERAMVEMMSRLYRIPAGACAMNAASDPLYDARDRGYAPQPAYAPQYAPQAAPQASYNRQPVPQERYNDQTRQDPYRWYGDSDPAVGGLRGRIN